MESLGTMAYTWNPNRSIESLAVTPLDHSCRRHHRRPYITISPGLPPSTLNVPPPTVPVSLVSPCFHECTIKQLIGWSLCVTTRCAPFLFGLSFFACILTVSTSNMLPCPAHPLSAIISLRTGGVRSLWKSNREYG